MRPLTRKLLLEARTHAPDGGGGTSASWTPVTELWAAIRARSAREAVVAGRQMARVSHTAEIRYLPFGDPMRPVPHQRLREGGRVFAIVGVAEADDRRERLICWLEEGTAP
ncbi:MAG: head-tail adaptor protein [Pseudomonadota bacterium]